MTVTHKKGKHFANFATIWQQLRWWVIGVQHFEICFTDESKYRLDKGDQYDWIKVVGKGTLITYKGIRESEDIAVCRYIPEKDEFHFSTEYKRREYQMILPEEWVVLKTGQRYIFSIKEFKGFWVPIFAYFGGNRTAPTTVRYELKRAPNMLQRALNAIF